MKTLISGYSPLLHRLMALLLALGVANLILPHAMAQTAEALNARAAELRAKANVWGEVNIGSSSRAEPDARVQAIGDKISQGGPLARRQAAAPAAVPAAAMADGQQAALAALRASVGPNVEVHIRPGNRTVAQIRGGILGRAVSGIAKASEAALAERTAREFLRANAALLRIDDPDAELRLESSQTDTSGGRHLRFSQVYQDVLVWPAGLSVHLDAQGNVSVVDGAYIPSPRDVGVQPALTRDEAKRIAAASVLGEDAAASGEPDLIVHAPLNGAARLAWKVNVVRDLAHAWRVIVDATDGRILNRTTLCYDANVQQTAKGLDNVNRTVNVWSQDGKFSLKDTTKKMFVPGSDPFKATAGVITVFDAREVVLKDLKTAFVIESVNGSDWLPDGISALYNFSLTYDYFLERHERNSLDGNGGNIDAIVRVKDMDNAFWNGNLKVMVFGNAKPYPLALDVVGHELAHGVTENTANLIYEMQSGAMNESFSDIFGTMVEARARGQVNWTLGEEVGKIFRDLKNPGAVQIGGLNRPFPSKMSEFVDLPNSDDSDHGGVHINSSIMNHCFYQLAEGLPGAIGLRDAERIFYRCLSQHLQKQSQFIDARLGCIASAEALFGAGSTQARKTAEAFDAVEILATPPTPAPTPVPTVTGEDSALFVTFDPFAFAVALGRRENAKGDPVDGVALAEGVKEARPSVSGDGSAVVLVSGNNDLCIVSTDNPADQLCLGVAGFVHSVAVSPDANLVAFVLRNPVTGQADNQISVYNLTTKQTRTFNLLAPVIDASPVDNVLYADSMVFSTDGKQLIYDAVSEIRFGGGNPVQRWSIFRINLATETTTVLVPPLEGIDFGNPNLGRAGNRYLTFDARSDQSGKTAIINLDLFTGEFGDVGFVGQGVGYPCFNGDESAVIYATQDANATLTGFSLVTQALAANRLAKNGQPSIWVQDAKIGVVYRRGTFVAENALPTVTLTSPANNSTLKPPATITLAANASDADGSIVKVEFYEGANKLGESVMAPYSFAWTAVPTGSYRLIARAYDNLGGAADSAAVNVNVTQDTTAGLIKLLASAGANGTIRINITASGGNYTLQRSSDLKSWTDQDSVGVPASGSVTTEAQGPGAGSTAVFYRLRKN